MLVVQAKKNEDLKEVTHKVYFDVEIAGKPAGMFLNVVQVQLYKQIFHISC